MTPPRPRSGAIPPRPLETPSVRPERVRLELWYDNELGGGTGYVTAYGPEDNYLEVPGRSFGPSDAAEAISLLVADLLIAADLSVTDWLL